ncbi:MULTISPECIES: IS66 family insertion sequence element accessory protein TnpB [unclassified Bradyrhizobium]|uniref:IS66 family insertion sequence element accessory protein TnpB n=1 Tax=Bradyrhizobium TaxID=374 RepID=UPI0035AF4D5E
MIPIPTGVRVWLATGYTDMRCGFPSLALRVQEVLKQDPLGGNLFCFRGKRGDLLKVFGMMARGHACLQKDLRDEGSSRLRLQGKQ